VICPAIVVGVFAVAATTSWACATKSAIMAPLTAWLKMASRLLVFS
jgi:hypothetical protein